MKFYGISVLEMFHFKGKISSPNFIILKLFVIYQTALLMIKIFISSSILSSIECFITLYLLSLPFRKTRANFRKNFKKILPMNFFKMRMSAEWWYHVSIIGKCGN